MLRPLAYVCYSDCMADIQVRGDQHIVTLSRPDEDGYYTWQCWCGMKVIRPRPIADAIAEAEVHIWAKEGI